MQAKEILKRILLFRTTKKRAAGAISTALGLAVAINGWAAEWNPKGGEKDEAMSLTPNLENGVNVYEHCIVCHTPEGWGTKDGSFPQLAGQHRSVLIKQLADMRALNRHNPTMYPFTLPQSIGGAQAIADVAEYLQRLPMNPDNGKGPWDDKKRLAHGKRLFENHCVKCHGHNGEGDDQKFYPRIQGQHYAYMLRQLEQIRDGKRRNVDPEAVKQIKGFSNKEMRIVINYVSRIPVPKEDLASSTDWKNPDFD
jgi:cytochrome c553